MASARHTTPTGGRQKTRTRSTEEATPSPARPLKRRSANKPQHDTTYDYRIGLDFGTKFTSVACSIRGSPPFTIQEFPDDPRPGLVNMQVPTEILYLSPEIKGVSGDGRPTHTNIYGYQIQERRNWLDINDDGMQEIGHITNVKLLLDRSAHLKSLQKGLRDSLRNLKMQKAIAKHEDVIRDLLECYLQHTKKILTRDYGLKSDSTVEVTFCVPVCWDPAANAIMSACVQEALRNVDLGIGAQNICNLFMVNEAEAAAMHTLSAHIQSYDPGEVFLLLDCGGGTTDVGVYEISHDYPFRLGKQVNPTSGAVCGSSDVNQAFFDFAMKHLQQATITAADPGVTEHLIETDIMPIFENTTKRSFSFKHKEEKGKSYPFRIRGVQKIKGNSRIQTNSFVLSYDDMEALFMPSLSTIADLMRKQILRTLRFRYKLNKVVVAGGFSDSPALKEFLTSTLDDINTEENTRIKIITAPQNTAAAGVALGALLRAADKEHGPAKVPCQSIGLYHHVRYEPELYDDDVLDQKPDQWELCDQDGQMYIKNTIQWIIKKGTGTSQSVHEYEWESLHIFTPADTSQWLAEYQLFASDECTEDFYKRSHPKNRGKTHKIGKVMFDLMPIRPHLHLHTADDEDDGQDRYEPTIRIKMKVIDKHLDFTAYYPAEGLPEITIPGAHEHLNVISAFKPGTG